MVRAKEAFQGLYKKERVRAANDADWWDFRDWAHNQLDTLREECQTLPVQSCQCDSRPSLIDRMEEPNPRFSTGAVGGGGLGEVMFADLQREVARVANNCVQGVGMGGPEILKVD